MADVKAAMEAGLKEGKILLLKVPSTEYRTTIKELGTYAAGKFDRVCYVTVNDPATKVRDSIGSKAGGFIFVDCISASAGSRDIPDNVIQVSSPKALTEISIACTKALQQCRGGFFVLDSLSAMSVYEDVHNILKFVHGLILMLGNSGVSACFVILKEDANEGLLKDMAMFVDKVIGLD